MARKAYPYSDPYYWTSGSTSSASTYSSYYPEVYYSGGQTVPLGDTIAKMQHEMRRLAAQLDYGNIGVKVDELPPPKPKEPDNIAWLRQRINEITTCGKLAA